MLYNGILRGFGFCGTVAIGIEFWSKNGKFEQQCKSRTVEDRMASAGHKYSSTVHALVSAVKQLQISISNLKFEIGITNFNFEI